MQRAVAELPSAAARDMIQAVESAECRGRLADGALRCLSVRGVTGKCERLSAEHNLCARDAVRVATDNHDMRARCDERFRRRQAEARGAADDDDDFAGESVNSEYVISNS